MLTGLWRCHCGGGGGVLYERGCACGGAVHFHTCLTPFERDACVCEVCRVPFGTDLTAAICRHERSMCTWSDEHHLCDMRCLRQLAPCLELRQEAELVAQMCLRRLRNNSINRDLLALFLRLARLQLEMQLYKRVKQTVGAIHVVFDDLYPDELCTADAVLEVAVHNSA